MIAIIDYGTGNVTSLRKAFERVGVSSVVTSDHQIIKQASKIVLPGIGAFDHAMGALASQALVPVLHEKVLHDKTPVLGICLGAQLLGLSSEEGQLAGLGWIDMRSEKFDSTVVRVPHIGWSPIEAAEASPLFANPQEKGARFYFLHSFHMVCQKDENIAARAYYGHEFVCAVQKDNIYGVQFHPEKSHRWGDDVLGRFAHA